MSLSDFTKYFYIATVSFANRSYVQSFMQDQVFSYKWGAFRLDMPQTSKDCFFTLYQQNDRFMNDFGGEEDYQYAEMQLIVTKVIKIPPKTGQQNAAEITGECAFIDGVTDDMYNACNLKIDKMSAGKYIIFYTAKFRKD